MTAGVVLLFVGLVLLSGSALVAFAWSVGAGQLRGLDAAPELIFDEQEPVGAPTDCFPDRRSRQAMTQFFERA